MKSLMLKVSALGLLGACATSSDLPAALFSSYKIGSDVNVGVKPAKVGTACSHIIDFSLITTLMGVPAGKLLTFSFGDGSVSTAAQNAGITKVATVDQDIFSILPYGKRCAVVAGE